jgi:hypothetical protein
MDLFDSLGFQWNRGSMPRQFPRASLERVVLMAFVLDCHPSAAEVYRLNPALSRIEDAPRVNYFRLDEPVGQTHEIEQSSDKYRSDQIRRDRIEPQRSGVDRQNSNRDAGLDHDPE